MVEVNGVSRIIRIPPVRAPKDYFLGPVFSIMAVCG
jgi:hypothetical protein